MITHLLGSKRHFFVLFPCRLDSNTPPQDLSLPVFFMSIFMMPALLNAPLPRMFVRQQMIPLPRIDAMNTGEKAVHLNETRMATVMKPSSDTRHMEIYNIKPVYNTIIKSSTAPS